VKVGADIEAVCGRCGEVWHVIVAIANASIARVECKQCGKRHRYRSVGRASVSATPTRRHAGSKPRARREEPRIEMDPSRPLRTYQSTDHYRVGDRIEHPRFGAGVVERVAGPGKVQVFFPDGHRVLVHGRDAAHP